MPFSPTELLSFPFCLSKTRPSKLSFDGSISSPGDPVANAMSFLAKSLTASAFAPCAAVAKSAAFFPLSTRLPELFSPAKFPTVAPDTLFA